MLFMMLVSCYVVFLIILIAIVSEMIVSILNWLENHKKRDFDEDCYSVYYEEWA